MKNRKMQNLEKELLAACEEALKKNKVYQKKLKKTIPFFRRISYNKVMETFTILRIYEYPSK